MNSDRGGILPAVYIAQIALYPRGSSSRFLEGLSSLEDDRSKPIIKIIFADSDCGMVFGNADCDIHVLFMWNQGCSLEGVAYSARSGTRITDTDDTAVYAHIARAVIVRFNPISRPIKSNFCVAQVVSGGRLYICTTSGMSYKLEDCVAMSK